MESDQISPCNFVCEHKGKLMLVNLRLKIRAVWDSGIENQSSNFSNKKKNRFWQEKSTLGFLST